MEAAVACLENERNGGISVGTPVSTVEPAVVATTDDDHIGECRCLMVTVELGPKVHSQVICLWAERTAGLKLAGEAAELAPVLGVTSMLLLSQVSLLVGAADAVATAGDLPAAKAVLLHR